MFNSSRLFIINIFCLLIIATCGICSKNSSKKLVAEKEKMVVIIVHGGAGTIRKENFEPYIKGVILAAKKGYAQLKNNQSALDAVVTSAISMENDPNFNAGIGSSLTINGTVENDALVMDGKDMQVGAVATVSRFRNPIQVAKLVLEKSDHCILSGEGAHLFAEKNGIKLIENKELVSQRSLDRLLSVKTFRETAEQHRLENERLTKQSNQASESEKVHDTVGAVALDVFGNLACSTTTGGLTAKALGRVGDSPIAGSGGWAQNDLCGISTTGDGELILRVALAKHIAMQLEFLHEQNSKEQKKLSNKDILIKAVDSGLNFMKEKVSGFGGVISVDKNGEFAARFTTPNMSWAAIDGKKIYYGISQDQIEEMEFTEME